MYSRASALARRRGRDAALDSGGSSAMSWQQFSTVVASAGHLALAMLAWQRSRQSRVAAVLSVLLLDVFGWSFAGLARELSGDREWALVDRFFASLLPALALDVVASFVGKVRAWRALVLGAHASFGLLALAATFGGLPYSVWWRVLLGGAVLAMSFALRALAEHARRSVDRLERARTRMIAIAIAVATLVGSSDLWLDKLGLPRLEASNVGMFAAMALLAVASLRLELLGGAPPHRLVRRALAFGALGAVACLLVLHSLERSVALAVFGAVTTVGLVAAGMFEIVGMRAAVRENTERLVLLGRWSEQLAHDLGNPLAALKGALQFLSEERRAGRSLDSRQDYLTLMLEQCDRLQNSVQMYRRLARVEPVVSANSLNDLVARVLSLQTFATQPGISLEQRLSPGLPSVDVDRDLVAIALENIIQNAYEALSTAGRVLVRTELDASDSAPQVVISVEDDGPGIDPRLEERVTDALVTTKPRGSGLGLAFAVRVARAHRGKLEIDTVLGRGTRVRMSFPVVDGR
jgi:two-component system sensor histidine kinase HydH